MPHTTPLRIFVVDDMAVYREPIAEALCHHGFEAVGYPDAEAALGDIRERLPDLILLDVAMPGLDGPGLAQALRALPGGERVPVIMLTAGSDREQVRRLVAQGVSDYMLKSQFSLVELVAKIEKVMKGSSRSRGPSAKPGEPTHLRVIETRRDQLEKLTPLLEKAEIHAAFTQGKALVDEFSPTIALVLRLLTDPATDIDDIVKAVRNDHNLSLKLVKVANSAAYAAGPQRVTTLNAAVMRIGTTRIGEVVTSIGFIDHFLGRDQLAGMAAGQFWEHSIAVGMIASMLGEKLRHPLAERLFIVGVLHDIGRLIIGYAFPERYAEVVERARDLHLPLEEVERQCLGNGHGAFGGALVSHWGYGEEIGRAIAGHHKRGHREPSAAIVDLADRLAHGLLIGCSLSDRLAPVSHLVARLGLDPETIGEIVEAAPAACLDMKLALLSSVRHEAWPQFDQELFAKARNRLRPVVFARNGVSDPVGLWCQRLAAQARSPTPNIGVLHLESGHLSSLLGAFKAWEREHERQNPLPIVILTDQEVPLRDLPAEAGRRSAVVRTPAGMRDLLAVMTELVGDGE